MSTRTHVRGMARRATPAAFTLIELLLAMTIMTILMGAMGSAILIAGRTAESGRSPTRSLRDGADVLDQITSDLRLAISFDTAERTPTSVQFTVPDRDGDGLLETIRYAWTGPEGQVLTRQQNGFDPVVIAESVEHFDLRYLVTSITGSGGTSEGSTGAALRVLYVVDKPDNLRTEETMRIFLMESWGYTVDPIDDDADQLEFDAAFPLHDVVHVSPSARHNQVGAALVAAPIGLVNENGNACETLDLAERRAETDASFAGLIISDNSHYITRPFVIGLVPLLTSDEQLIHFDRVETPLAAGATALGHLPDDVDDLMLVAIEESEPLFSGAPAPARRVIMPWAEDRTFNVLNDNGRTVLRRALEWAAEQEQPEVFNYPLYVQYEDPAQSSSDHTVKHDNWAVASIIPELAEDAVSWKVTSASFIAMQKGDPLSTLVIQVRRQGPPTTDSPPAPGPPLSEILAQTTLLETELPLVYGWVQVTFDMEQSLSPSEGVCITIGTNSGSDAAEVLYQNGGAAPTPSNQFWKGKSGDWSMSAGRDIPIELQGTVETP